MSQWKEYASGNTPGISSPHAKELYRFDHVASGIDGFANVTDEHVRQFHEQGYLAIHNAFTQAEVDATLEGLLDIVDGKYPAYDGLQFEPKAQKTLAGMSREEKQDVVRKAWKFVNFDKRLKDISEHPSLIALLRRIIGGDVFMFQDMALLKPPKIGREKPWHQDAAYFDYPVGTLIVGCWIALDEATIENGCMHIIPGSHREGPVIHFNRRDWQICDSMVRSTRDMVVPLKPGGCLLFHGLLHHGTPTNHSPSRRRAIQFHYHPAGVKETTLEERLTVFGPEGKNVEC